MLFVTSVSFVIVFAASITVKKIGLGHPAAIITNNIKNRQSAQFTTKSASKIIQRDTIIEITEYGKITTITSISYTPKDSIK